MFTIGPPFWAGGDVKLTQYFTSVVYPIMFEDELDLQISKIQSGASTSYIWELPKDDANIATPTIVSGSLETTIVRLEYTTEIEVFGMDTPTIVDGSLVSTVVRLELSTEIDPMSIATPTIVSGSLNIGIVRLEYLDWVPEATDISTPAIIGGSLT